MDSQSNQLLALFNDQSMKRFDLVAEPLISIDYINQLQHSLIYMNQMATEIVPASLVL